MKIINFIALTFSVLALIYALYVNTVLIQSLEDCTEISILSNDETGSGTTEWFDTGDMINHPEYGIYQKEVPFYQGMTIMPGQSATFDLEWDGQIETSAEVDWDTTGTKIELR